MLPRPTIPAKIKHESARSFSAYFDTLTRKLAFRHLASLLGGSMSSVSQALIEERYGDELDRIETDIIATMRTNGKVIDNG